MHSIDINDLYKKALDGDKVAENQLFSIIRVRFRTFVKYKIRETNDVEDIVHNALLTISGKYRTTEMTSTFAAWAYGVLRNELLRYYRDSVRKNKVMSSIEEAPEIVSNFQTDPELRRKLKHCLTEVYRINPRYAEVLHLIYQGYKSAEICRRLGVTANNLYIILFRARAALKLCLDR